MESVNMNTFAHEQLADIDEQIRGLDQKREILFVMRRAVEDKLKPQTDGAPLFTGFRDAIRDILKAHPEGLTGKGILQILRNTGELSKYTGKVKPSVRVHNELYNLKNRKEVSAREGKYTLKTRLQ